MDSTLLQINNTSFVTILTSYLSATDPLLEYRHLVPQKTKADWVTTRLREGREQLAVMLTLMTLELEDRRQNIKRIHDEQMFVLHSTRIVIWYQTTTIYRHPEWFIFSKNKAWIDRQPADMQLIATKVNQRLTSVPYLEESRPMMESA